MARSPRTQATRGSISIHHRRGAKDHAAARTTGAASRDRSDRGLGKDRWHFYRVAFSAGLFAGRHFVRPRFATDVALRARSSFQGRYPPKIEAALWSENDSRYSLSG